MTQRTLCFLLFKAAAMALLLQEETAMGAQGVADHFLPSLDPFSSLMPLDSLPQFIVLTFDDSVTPWIVDLYSQIATIRHQDGCPITATWYVSIASRNDGEVLTKCSLVNALRRGGHEIATHTYGHTGDPTAKEIERARTWLRDECGVPKEEMRGFRAPNLKFSQETFEHLHSLGFLYDSSIPEQRGSNGDPRHVWPYTMDVCGPEAWNCNANKSVPQLYEVPMWTMYDQGGMPMIPMDYPGDVYAILSQNFESRYDVANGGNRAPLGIFLHAAWMLANGSEFYRWIEDVLAKYDDVHFVTNFQLLQWMSNPVPAREYEREEFCDDLQPECFPPSTSEGGCGFGDFDPTSCQCRCLPPYTGQNCMSYDPTATVQTTTTSTPLQTVETSTVSTYTVISASTSSNAPIVETSTITKPPDTNALPSSTLPVTTTTQLGAAISLSESKPESSTEIVNKNMTNVQSDEQDKTSTTMMPHVSTTSSSDTTPTTGQASTITTQIGAAISPSETKPDPSTETVKKNTTNLQSNEIGQTSTTMMPHVSIASPSGTTPISSESNTSVSSFDTAHSSAGDKDDADLEIWHDAGRETVNVSILDPVIAPAGNEDDTHLVVNYDASKENVATMTASAHTVLFSISASFILFALY